MEVKYRLVTTTGREIWTTVGGVLPQMQHDEDVLVIQRHGPGDLDDDEKRWLLANVTPYMQPR